VRLFLLSLVGTFGALALTACVSVPESQTVHVIGELRAAPIGCKDLGRVTLTDAAAFNLNPLSSPNDELLRMMTLEKGGDTLHYTGMFPLRGVAYKCGEAK
jgi:hypothetical protein